MKKLSREAESAVTNYLRNSGDLPGLHIYAGHERADELKFPALVIYAETSSPHPEMPRETGVRIVRMRCKITVDSEDFDRDSADQWGAILDRMLIADFHDVQCALNPQEPDDGSECHFPAGVHFHHAELADDPSDREETDWVDDLLIDLVCEPVGGTD